MSDENENGFLDELGDEPDVSEKPQKASKASKKKTSKAAAKKVVRKQASLSACNRQQRKSWTSDGASPAQRDKDDNIQTV